MQARTIENPVFNDTVSYQQRVARAVQWADQLDVLRDRLVDGPRANVQAVMDFFDEHVSPVELVTSPDGEEWALATRLELEQPDNKKVGMLALFGSDLELHDNFKTQANTLTYNVAARTIIIPPKRVTPTWRGILTFHESEHARNHLAGVHRDQADGHWAEEYEVYTSEIEIMRQLYGEQYDRVVANAAEAVKAAFETGYPSSKAILHAVDPNSLTPIMGKPASAFELGIRQSAANFDAIYTAFDAMGRDDHARVTEWVYGG